MLSCRGRGFKALLSGMVLICLCSLFFTSDHKSTQEQSVVVEPIKNVLVDMPEIATDIYFNNSLNNKSSFLILFINKSRYMNLKAGNDYIKDKCYFKNCILTDVANNISQMAAIVFNAQDVLRHNSTYLKKNRHGNQIWIIYRAEPIGNIRANWFKDLIWKNTMNWTWGYRHDSDIFLPHQILTTRRTRLNRNYYSVYKKKTKMAAWIVSHCHAKSLRDEYVHALIKEGVNVDIFGLCSKNKTRIDRNLIRQQINRSYKFFLSFENNFCKDYVSEKFFSYLSLDTVLIVRGGLNYSEHFDRKAFIDASSFSTVKSLAKYMLRVANDSKLYSSYLRAKDKYIINGTPGYSRTVSTCRLCEHMNNAKRYTKTYGDVASYFLNGTCFNPTKVV